jgi:hypothetical protein
LFAIGSVRAAVTVGRKMRVCPVIFRRVGRMNTSKETMAAAGLPGRAKTGFPSRMAKATAFRAHDLPELDSPPGDDALSRSPVADGNAPGGDRRSPRIPRDPVASPFHPSSAIPSMTGSPPDSITCGDAVAVAADDLSGSRGNRFREVVAGGKCPDLGLR